MKKAILRLFAAAAMSAYGMAAFAQSAAPSTTSPTVDAIRARGSLLCGVIGSAVGFSLPDSKGEMRGIDADACRALAAAVLGDGTRVKLVSLTPQQRLTALQSGEVDVVYANLTWTMTRETRSGVRFIGVHYYDGVGFMVPKSIGVRSAKELKGAAVCVLSGPAEVVVQEFFSKIGADYKPVTFSDGEEMRKAFLSGRCDAYASDQSSVAAIRSSLGAGSEDYVILPEIISNEPLGGAIRKGDDRWFDIARYTHFALVTAEAPGITSQNVKTFQSKDPAVRRFLGEEGDLGASMGLDNRWAVNVIAAVGNYGEV